MLELLTNPPSFLILAFIAGSLMAVTSASAGVFMVWQKQSYFGATIAHSGMLGISIGLFFQIDLTLSVVAVALLIALLIHWFQKHSSLSSDTLLGILAHASLAVGLVLLSLTPTMSMDLNAILFGDILSVTETDIQLLGALTLISGWFFYHNWQNLLHLTADQQMAQIEGVAVNQLKLQFTLLLALIIALSMKFIGVLLITSLLIIPVAAARRFSNTPEKMLFLGILFGLFSVFSGMFLSFFLDVPTGPAIVVIASLLFLFSLTLTKKPSP